MKNINGNVLTLQAGFLSFEATLHLVHQAAFLKDGHTWSDIHLSALLNVLVIRLFNNLISNILKTYERQFAILRQPKLKGLH